MEMWSPCQFTGGPRVARLQWLQGHVGLVIMLLLEVHSFEYGRPLDHTSMDGEDGWGMAALGIPWGLGW